MAKRSTRQGAYECVAENLVKQLEAGVAPWVRPWSGGGGLGLPENGSTGKRYRGANVLVLWSAAMVSGYDSNRWFTFKQAKSMGGSVRRGERGTEVLFWGSAKRVDTDNKGKDVERDVMFVRTYTVFAVEQTVRIEDAVEAEDAPAHPVDDWVDAIGATIVHRGASASYNSRTDVIRLPPRRRFDDDAAYFATKLHELAHWTGHEGRLARDLRGRCGSESYAKEELVAEIGAAFLCASLGIEGRLQHAEYLAHWVKVVRSDPSVFVRAASKAQKVADYLHGIASGFGAHARRAGE